MSLQACSALGAGGIAITGIGALLPNTNCGAEMWSHLSTGNSQVDFLTRFDTFDFPVKTAAEIRPFDYRDFLPDLPDRFAAKYTRDILVVMSALESARQDARLDRESADPTRVGFVASCSRGPIEWWYQTMVQCAGSDPVPVSANLLPGLPGSPASLGDKGIRPT